MNKTFFFFFTDKIKQLLSSFGQHFRTKPTLDRSHDPLVRRDAVDDANALGNTTANAGITQSADCYFEDYEKQYFIYQIINLMTQMYEYKEYIDNNKTRNEVIRLHIPKPKCMGPSMTSTSSVSPSATHVTQSTTPFVTPTVMLSQAISPTIDGSRASALNEAMLHKLEHMSLRQLDQLFHQVKGNAQSGTITLSISSLCCPI